MAWSVAAKVAAHQGLLDKLKGGSSGIASLDLYAGTTLLLSSPLDHAASAVSGTTGQLTLVPGAAAVGVADGVGTAAKLVARDGTVLDADIPVEAGVTAVSGKAVYSSLNILTGGTVTLVSAVVG